MHAFWAIAGLHSPKMGTHSGSHSNAAYRLYPDLQVHQLTNHSLNITSTVAQTNLYIEVLPKHCNALLLCQSPRDSRFTLLGLLLVITRGKARTWFGISTLTSLPNVDHSQCGKCAFCDVLCYVDLRHLWCAMHKCDAQGLFTS
jgi:hypothetical protein